MNSETFGRKRALIPALGTIAALAIGGTAWASSTDNVTGSDRDRIGKAAVAIAGGGSVEEVERSDDLGEAYDVDIRRKDGTEVEISLDKNLKEASRENDADDRVLSSSERASAQKAALAAVGSGTATDIEASDDPGTAYEVEVHTAKGVEWDVDLDANFAVVSKTKDN